LSGVLQIDFDIFGTTIIFGGFLRIEDEIIWLVDLTASARPVSV
jgi:hypothetical protein